MQVNGMLQQRVASFSLGLFLGDRGIDLRRGEQVAPELANLLCHVGGHSQLFLHAGLVPLTKWKLLPLTKFLKPVCRPFLKCFEIFTSNIVLPSTEGFLTGAIARSGASMLEQIHPRRRYLAAWPR